MSQTIFLLVVNTIFFSILGLLAAWRTRDTRWPFIFGFFSLLPATLILASLGTGDIWRRAAIVILVAIYVARMLYTLLFWFQATGAAKLKKQTTIGQLLVLPLILVPIFSWLYPLPFFAAMNRTSPFNIFDATALLIYMVGTAFHLGADLEKWRFKENAGNKGHLLQKGLWGLSRHPNYFGDFLIYCAFALVAQWPWGLVAPLVNLIQYFADAIPKNERSSSKRYGEVWAHYVKTTPIFLPVRFKRHNTTNEDVKAD